MKISMTRAAVCLVGASLALAGCVTAAPDGDSGPPPTYFELFDPGFAMFERVSEITETTMAELTTVTGSASYAGYLSGDSSSNRFLGQLDLNANFATNKVSGTVKNLVSTENDTAPSVYYKGTIPISGGSIEDVEPGTFSQVVGNFNGSIQSGGVAGTFGGSFGGDFRGSGAEAILGEFSGTVTVGSTPESISGEIYLEK